MRLWLALGVCCLLLLSSSSLRTASATDNTEEETGENFDADMKKAAPPSASQTAHKDDDDFGDDDAGATMVDDDDMMPPGEMGVEEEPDSAKPVEPLDYSTPMPQGFYYFADPFLDTKGIGKRWHVSTAKKDDTDDSIAKYNGEWDIGLPEKVALKNDYGLIVKSKARHHAIAAKLDRPVQFDGKPLVVQYEVKYQNGQECGGGYMKLLSKGAEKDLKNFQDKTPYSIMFGPDKCGMTSKVHFIIRYENPKNHTISEYHAKQTSKSLDDYFSDHKSHLYTLVINPDNTYQILIDQREITSGSLLKDLEPPMTPPKEIDDPADKKPDDWDDREKIVDPDAKKPEDWDEDAPKEIEDPSATKPADWLDDEEDLIPDPEASKPGDWDTEMDGEWEAPRIKNPKCEGVSGCGKWSAPKIANPAYKGKWKAPKIANPEFKGRWSPRRIENPHYFDPEPYKMTPITAIGLELWTMSEGILFDNFLMTDDKATADNFAKQTWVIKAAQENIVQKSGSKDGFFNGLVSAAEERPWLWAVYILTVLLPIVLITVFCFGGSKDKTAVNKKTDAVQPDVAEEEQDIDDDEEEEEEEEAVKHSPKKADKASSQRSSPRKQNKGKAALEDDEEEEEEKAEETSEAKTPTPKGSPGRRVRQRRQD